MWGFLLGKYIRKLIYPKCYSKYLCTPAKIGKIGYYILGFILVCIIITVIIVILMDRRNND